MWKIAAAAGLFLSGFYLGHLLTSQAWEAEKAKQLSAAINSHLADEKTNHVIGLNLETGLNDYRKTVRSIPDAHDDNSGVFSNRELLALSKRLAASGAAAE